MHRLEAPRARVVPVVVEVPHASVALPEEVRPLLLVDAPTLRRDADSYVDELYRDAPDHGAALLVAGVSRYVVDLNREEHDLDGGTVQGVVREGEAAPRGVIWRETGEGRVALRRALTRDEFDERLARYYRPYHRALHDALMGLRARHRHVLLVAAHSMPSTGRAVKGEARVRRADVVPGTRARSTAARALIDVVEQHFRAAGLSVRHDDPYRGGATTARWGRPHEGMHAIQIELNRALYMDERSGEPRPEALSWLRGRCAALVQRLAVAVTTLR